MLVGYANCKTASKAILRNLVKPHESMPLVFHSAIYASSAFVTVWEECQITFSEASGDR